MIERQKKKRAFEVSLPPLEHSEAFEVRRKMMEEQELLEWEIREQQIRMYLIRCAHLIELLCRVQQERLKMMKQALAASENERELLNTCKVESIMNRSASKRDAEVQKIQKKRKDGQFI